MSPGTTGKPGKWTKDSGEEKAVRITSFSRLFSSGTIANNKTFSGERTALDVSSH